MRKAAKRKNLLDRISYYKRKATKKIHTDASREELLLAVIRTLLRMLAEK